MPLHVQYIVLFYTISNSSGSYWVQVSISELVSESVSQSVAETLQLHNSVSMFITVIQVSQ